MPGYHPLMSLLTLSNKCVLCVVANYCHTCVPIFRYQNIGWNPNITALTLDLKEADPHLATAVSNIHEHVSFSSRSTTHFVVVTQMLLDCYSIIISPLTTSAQCSNWSLLTAASKYTHACIAKSLRLWRNKRNQCNCDVTELHTLIEWKTVFNHVVNRCIANVWSLF